MLHASTEERIACCAASGSSAGPGGRRCSRFGCGCRCGCNSYGFCRFCGCGFCGFCGFCDSGSGSGFAAARRFWNPFGSSGCCPPYYPRRFWRRSCSARPRASEAAFSEAAMASSAHAWVASCDYGCDSCLFAEKPPSAACGSETGSCARRRPERRRGSGSGRPYPSARSSRLAHTAPASL